MRVSVPAVVPAELASPSIATKLGAVVNAGQDVEVAPEMVGGPLCGTNIPHQTMCSRMLSRNRLFFSPEAGPEGDTLIICTDTIAHGHH